MEIEAIAVVSNGNVLVIALQAMAQYDRETYLRLGVSFHYNSVLSTFHSTRFYHATAKHTHGLAIDSSLCIDSFVFVCVCVFILSYCICVVLL